MGRCNGGDERKSLLVKDYVVRDDDAMNGEIKAAIAFMRGGIAYENTGRRSRREFMRSCGGEVWIP
jgi:hypothetical protein